LPPLSKRLSPVIKRKSYPDQDCPASKAMEIRLFYLGERAAVEEVLKNSLALKYSRNRF
jgi:hypothetical protein